MILSPIKMNSCYRLAQSPVLFCGLLVLAGCAEQAGLYGQSDDSKSGLNMGQAPAMLTRAVELSQLRPIVSMNGLVVEAESSADGNWFVDYTLFDSSLQIEITWVENFEGQDLVLATYSNSFGEIMSNSRFTVPVAEYITEHDIDNDGVTNLQERVNSTDPYTSPIPNADAQGVWAAECTPGDDVGEFERIAVTFGPTAYQLTTVSYIDAEDCFGELFVSANVIGTYVVSGETSVLADGSTAKHLYIRHINGTITASTEANEFLAEQGLTLVSVLDDPRVTNANDVPLEVLGAPEELYSIYRVENNHFISGASLGSQDGTTAERRHRVLDETVQFRKQ